MQRKVMQEGPERTFALVLEPGEEVLTELRSFARELELAGSHFTGIGAFESVTLGFFDLDRKDYHRTAVREQVEVLTLAGNIALVDGGPGDPDRKVHAHVVLGRRDGTAIGGHLLEARVRPTLEIFLVESPRWLQRTHDPTTGLALIDMQP